MKSTKINNPKGSNGRRSYSVGRERLNSGYSRLLFHNLKFGHRGRLSSLEEINIFPFASILLYQLSASILFDIENRSARLKGKIRSESGRVRPELTEKR